MALQDLQDLRLYSWLFWILNARLSAGDITLIHIAAFSMMIGMAHYRLGKAAGDALWKSASLHVVVSYHGKLSAPLVSP